MKNLYARIAALCVWFVPGVDDAVEFFFQIVVLVASS